MMLHYPTSWLTSACTAATSDWIVSPSNWALSTNTATTAITWPCDIRIVTQQSWLRPRAPAILSALYRARLQAEERAFVEMERADRETRETRQQLARARARALLMGQLSQEQRETLERSGYFDIRVADKVYRIRQGTHGNVRLLENGREVASYCAQPSNVPAEDSMLGQMLMLQTDEQAFLSVANRRVIQ